MHHQLRPTKPEWLRRRLPSGSKYEVVRELIRTGRLKTVCQEAKCPNIWECFQKGTATFMILGAKCTRNCMFCAVESGPDESPDDEEPQRVAAAVKNLGLNYVVITSVTRDDLPDGGASHFADTITAVRDAHPGILIEVLIPDFQGSHTALKKVLDAGPHVLNHNIETVPRLYPLVRPQAVFKRSLELLKRAAEHTPAVYTKSGMMLGLGETDAEIKQTLCDLLQVNCRVLTLGQYLQPSAAQLPVKHYVHPDDFKRWEKIAMKMGFTEVASGPFVRSSYHAKTLYEALRVRAKINSQMSSVQAPTQQGAKIKEYQAYSVFSQRR